MDWAGARHACYRPGPGLWPAGAQPLRLIPAFLNARRPIASNFLVRDYCYTPRFFYNSKASAFEALTSISSPSRIVIIQTSIFPSYANLCANL